MINNKKILIAITILTLVAFNVVQFLINQQRNQLDYEKRESQKMELRFTYTKLDTISKQLDEKIQQIKSLGGSVDSLLEIKNQLERDKYALKQINHIAKSRYESIKKKVIGYENLIAIKEQEIARFKSINQTLVDERLELLEKRDELVDEVSRLEEQKDRLLEQMSMAKTLNIKDIRFFSVNRNGTLSEGESFKNNLLNKLLITVKINKNQLAQSGKKEIAMRIIEPEGASLYNATSGTFKYKGKEMFYTAATEFYFDNKEEEVEFKYEKGNDYAIGKHKVELYCEGQRIGEGAFIIK